MSTLPAPSALDAAPSEHGTVAAYFRCFNDGNFDVLANLLADGWVDHAHPERHSAADVRRAFEAARNENPGTRILIDAVLGEGDLIEVNGRIVNGDSEERSVWIIKALNGRLHEIWTHTLD